MKWNFMSNPRHLIRMTQPINERRTCNYKYKKKCSALHMIKTELFLFVQKKKNRERECDQGKLCYTCDFHTDSIIFSSSSKLNAVRKVPMCYINLLSNVRKKELGKWVYVHRDGSVSYSMLFGIWISSLKYEKKLELEGCNGALCKAFPLFYDLSSCNFLFLSCYIIVLSKI